MQNKHFLRLMSIILTIVLVMAPILTVTAAAAEVQYTMDCPNIYVHGFMDCALIKNQGTDEEEVVWPVTVDQILTTVKECLPALTSFVFTRDWDKLADDILPYALDLLSPSFLDNNGEVNNNTGIDWVWPEASSIKKNSTISFKYDWRLDPVYIASQLNDYIDYVLECSGSDKVTLNCHSCGGVIAVAYMSIYGTDKIAGTVFNSTAIYGETYTGELMSGQICLNSDSFQTFFKYVFDETEYEELLNGLVSLLRNAGILEIVVKLGNDILANLSDKLLPAAVVPMFGGWLTIWAMVPDEYIEASMDYVFNTVYKDSGIDRTQLIEKINNYNELVRKNKTQTLTQLNETARVGVFSKYGYSSIPATPSWYNMSDGVVDTKYSSFGATTTAYGKVFSDEYLAVANEKYISPEKSIDASTALFPDQTWFIKYLKHSDGRGTLEELVYTILYADAPVTVDTYEEYPQFLIYDSIADDIYANTQTEVELSRVQHFWLAVKDFFKLIKSLFMSLFNK